LVEPRFGAVWPKPETKLFKVFQKLPNRLKSGLVWFKLRVNRLRKNFEKVWFAVWFKPKPNQTKPKPQVWFQFDHPDWF
jgi:hypothetical protein